MEGMNEVCDSGNRNDNSNNSYYSDDNNNSYYSDDNNNNDLVISTLIQNDKKCDICSCSIF